MPSLRTQRGVRHAALLVDYNNLHGLLAACLDDPEQARDPVAKALAELRRYLAEEDGTPVVHAAAYADFETLRGGGAPAQRALYQQGVEPRFVPATLEDGATQITLAAGAMRLTHRRPAVETVALVMGDRTYLPLLRALRREGVHAFVAALDLPPPGRHPYADGDLFMDLLNLLDDDTRRAILQSGEIPPRAGQASTEASPRPARYRRFEDDVLFRTLEITEKHFGQYDEVYLTPLLRKLSDVLGEGFDPKALVADLEEAGAVRLEKRRGYPYDYTVLIVERAHPDVQPIRDDGYDGEAREPRASPPSANEASLNDTSGYDPSAQDDAGGPGTGARQREPGDREKRLEDADGVH